MRNTGLERNELRGFRRKLLAWYRSFRRPLPWRDDPNPYKVWISEIMLQQTQCATVLPYYERFLRHFPDIESLARARETDVLQSWAGLGYYSRARNLHRAAQIVVQQHGAFPSNYADVMALPGIGRYTAGAICSIAFNQPYPAVDGNVRRVVARLAGVAQAAEKFCRDAISAWMDQKNPSEFNQGIMELGALVCVPRRPRCLECPVAGFCAARHCGRQDSIPLARPRPARKKVEIIVLILKQRGRLLLLRQSSRKLIPGDWALPWRIVREKESPESAASVLCRKVIGCEVSLKPGPKISHSITRHDITALGYYGSTQFSAGDNRWVETSEAVSLLSSSLFSKIISRLHGGVSL